MECVLEKCIWDYDFFEDNIYYIDNKDLLHRKNLKKDTDKIISTRKQEKVDCTKDGLFVNKYVESPNYETDELFYMDFDGKHEKRIAAPAL